MSKGGIARAAQALAPRVALSFLRSIEYLPLIFDIHDSIFYIFFKVFFDQTGRFAASGRADVKPVFAYGKTNTILPRLLPAFNVSKAALA